MDKLQLWAVRWDNGIDVGLLPGTYEYEAAAGIVGALWLEDMRLADPENADEYSFEVIPFNGEEKNG